MRGAQNGLPRIIFPKKEVCAIKICGFQKLTTLDFPDRLAATIFTGGCNLRCPFCHNASLVLRSPEVLCEDDILSYLEKRQGVLDGVCITGGEPLLQSGIDELIKKIKTMGYLIKLDTNGAFPELLSELLDQNIIDYVAMDLKNSPKKYPLTCGLEGKNPDDFFAPFKKSISILMSGKIDYEFRTTITPELHTLTDIEEMGAEIKGAKRWFLQCFKDSGDLIEGPFTEPTQEFMQGLKAKAENFAVLCEIRGM